MFLTKKRTKREDAVQFTAGDVELKVAENSEVYKQVQMIGLKTDDLIQMNLSLCTEKNLL